MLIVGFGLLLAGPLAVVSRSEDWISRDLAEARTAPGISVTYWWSTVGNVKTIIVSCLIVLVLLLWISRDWRLAVAPVLATVMETAIFTASTFLVNRPRPQVAHLDAAPPTSSYPSGHVGATTALYLTLALLAWRIERAWLRRTVIVLCLAMPPLVAFARLYRGMHHLSDVLVGLLNGVVCALLAYGWYRRRTRQLAAVSSHP